MIIVNDPRRPFVDAAAFHTSYAIFAVIWHLITQTINQSHVYEVREGTGALLPRWLEYHANLLSLKVLDHAVTRVVHKNMSFSDEKLEHVSGTW